MCRANGRVPKSLAAQLTQVLRREVDLERPDHVNSSLAAPCTDKFAQGFFNHVFLAPAVEFTSGLFEQLIVQVQRGSPCIAPLCIDYMPLRYACQSHHQ